MFPTPASPFVCFQLLLKVIVYPPIATATAPLAFKISSSHTLFLPLGPVTFTPFLDSSDPDLRKRKPFQFLTPGWGGKVQL